MTERPSDPEVPRLKGVLAPVVTPFKSDLSPNGERLAWFSKWLLGNGVGLAVFGTTSEGNSLSVDEKIELLDILVGAGVDPARMMPGTGCSALTDTVRLTAHAVKLGCAGVLMLPPFYYKSVSDDGLFRSFSEVIERVGDDRLRIYLYHIPPVSHVGISVRLIERLLAVYPRTIAGAKDSSGDWENTRAYIENFAPHGFDVFPGSESFLLRGMRAGGAGCISATANVNPAAIARLFSDWGSANADSAQLTLDHVRRVFNERPMIPSLKAAIAHYSGDGSWSTVRPPLTALPSEHQSALVRELESLGFSMSLANTDQ